MTIVRRLVRSLALSALVLCVLLPGAATGAQIHCGGHACANLVIRCTGKEACDVGIVGEGINGPFDVAVTRTHAGQTTTEQIVLDRLVNVTIRTGAGNDRINFDDAHFDGNLRINTGGGNDGISTQDWGVLGRTRIETGQGDDLIFFDAPGIGGPLFVLTGDGADTVDMALGAPAVSDDHKRFDGGRGNDTLRLTVAPPLRPATVKRFETVEPR